MAGMWSSNEDFDFEVARDNATKLVLIGSAYRAGIFRALEEWQEIPAIVRLLDADERALFIMLEALCALGYIDKKKTKYILSAKGRALFIEHGEDYVGGSLPHFLDIMEAWLKLPEILKGRKPERKEGNVAAFMNAMASRPDDVVEEAVDVCLGRKKDAKTVLDLGGGPGKYSKAFVKRGLKAVLYDLPDAIDYVKSTFGLEIIENLTLKKGDFTEDFVKEFRGQSFDMVFLGNVCHIYSEEENQILIKRAGQLLGNNGMIAIEDMVRGRSPMAEMFAVNMLANTESGNTYSEKQYSEWLMDAGFRKIEVYDLPEKRNQLITSFLE